MTSKTSESTRHFPQNKNLIFWLFQNDLSDPMCFKMLKKFPGIFTSTVSGCFQNYCSRSDYTANRKIYILHYFRIYLNLYTNKACCHMKLTANILFPTLLNKLQGKLIEV